MRVYKAQATGLSACKISPLDPRAANGLTASLQPAKKQFVQTVSAHFADALCEAEFANPLSASSVDMILGLAILTASVHWGD